MKTFIESIRLCEGAFDNLTAHQNRVNLTFAAFFLHHSPFDLSQIKIPEEFGQGLYKCRVLYAAEIQSIEFLPYHIQSIESLQLVELPFGADYSYKFAERSLLQEAFLQRKGADDVLIVREGLLTDTSYGNIALYDGKQWITPQKPLLKGTQRAKLLQEKIIFPKEVKTDDLVAFQQIKIFNALRIWEEVPQIPISAIRMLPVV